MEHTREQLAKIMRNLPEDLKESIASVNDFEIILGIKKKYGLHFDQTGELSDEILLVTIGITPPQEFIRNLQKRLNVPMETAQAIGVEVNEKIFKPVRESLKKIHQMEEDAEQEEQQKETASQPKPLDLKNKMESTSDIGVPVELPQKPKPDTYREPVE